MRLLVSFIVLLVIGSSGLMVAYDNLVRPGSGGAAPFAGLPAAALAGAALVLLFRIIYRISRPTRARSL